MAKLTRTQKYASLRDELANDKESNIVSQDLNPYASRFNKVQENLAPQSVVQTVEEKPAEKPVEKPDYVWKPYAEEEVKPVETISGSSYFDSFMKETTKDFNQAASTNDFSSMFENDKKVDINVDDFYKDVFNDVKDKTDDSISLKERDTYLNQTISDVNYHNIVEGEPTLNKIVDDAVNEVRHSDVQKEVVDDTYAWSPFVSEQELDADKVVEKNEFDALDKQVDETFSNTVTMEINKIMDQMANEPVVEKAKPLPVQEPIEEPVKAKAEEVAAKQVAIEEKPEEVVEIKNLNEIKDEPLKNTVSGTIPFVVSSDEEEDIEDDEDEDEGSNTVLNIILIILIVVLVAVLGLIIFYILKTKGIFG